MRNLTKPYVVHYCKRKRCNRAWLDIDEYNAKSLPPRWRYCKRCTRKGYVTEKNPERVKRGKKLAKMRKQKA